MTTAITDEDRKYIFTNFNQQLLDKLRSKSKRNTYDKSKLFNLFKIKK